MVNSISCKKPEMAPPREGEREKGGREEREGERGRCRSVGDGGSGIGAGDKEGPNIKLDSIEGISASHFHLSLE